jgi:hypothetical protein
MNDDYLWDRSGAPEADVEALEKRLAPLRYRHHRELLHRRPRRLWWGAAAAALVLATVAMWQVRGPQAQATGWQVANVQGGARLGGRDAAPEMAVRAGQVVRTGSEAEISLEAGELGRLDLFPNSELRASSLREVSLRRGKLHAFIWAPPRQFTVETPSSRAVDMGCEYTLTVDGSGNGLLQVAMGWVAFQSGSHEAFIPAGAACVTRRRSGPGIPYFEDAPEALIAGLPRAEARDRLALETVLGAARERDGLTLWHLLARVDEPARGQVFDRFRSLVKLPESVSREGVVRQDPAQMDLCWNALELENTEWWRGWKRNW